MITTLVDLGVTRGDSLERFFEIKFRDRTALTPEEGELLAAQFTDLLFQVRDDPDDESPLITADDSDGALEWQTSPRVGIATHIPATRMERLSETASYDLQLTEPRPGHPLGDLVWTLASGDILPRKDNARAARP